MKRSMVFGSTVVALVASAGMAQSVSMDNGVAGDGHLRIDTDAYGAYTNWGWGENLDYWDPAGPLGESNPMFAGSFMLYYDGVDRVAFGEPFKDVDNTYNVNGTYPGTFDLPQAVVGPTLNGAGDGASSSWSQENYAGDLSFDFSLEQLIDGDGNLTQELTITNRSSAGTVNIQVQRHLDLDLLWDASAEDVAGSVDNGGTYIPYQREPDGDPNSPSAIHLTSPDAYDFVASKSGFDGQGGSMGTGAGTSMAYGTDFQIWGEFGYPEGWRNYTAGIGHAPTVGELLGKQPVGTIAPFDAFINIEWDLTIPFGESVTITSVTGYGSTGAGDSCPCACNVDLTTGPDVCDIFDFLAFQNAFVGGESCACNIDTTTGPDVCDIFDFLAFQDEFVGGCP